MKAQRWEVSSRATNHRLLLSHPTKKSPFVSYYYGYGYGSNRSRSRAAARAAAAPQREENWRRGITYLLPALLLTLTCVVTGSYFETNDDAVMTLLLRGVIADKPVGDLHLYLHGISHIISGLYGLMPDVPWYGIVLYSALYLSMVLAFGLLHRLTRRIISNQQIALLLLFFYIATWLEHALWFNYTRVPVLLAAGAFLNYAFDSKEPGSRHTRILILCGMAFLLALCLRASAGLVGLILVLPGALRVPGRAGIDFRNLVTSLVPFALVGVGFYSLTILSRSDEEIAFQRLDQRNSYYQDFGLYYFKPATRADAPRTYAVKEAVRDWMLGDRQAVNEPFFLRAGGYNWGKFFIDKVPAKVKEVVPRVAKDYFLILLVNGLLVAYCFSKLKSPARRGLLILIQVWVLGLMLVMAMLLKLPPRLAGTALTVLSLLNFTFYLRHRRFKAPKIPGWVRVLLLVVLAAHVYRTGWRVLQLSDKERNNENFLNSLKLRFRGQTLVASGLETYMSNLSPWQTYSFGSNKLVALTGWQTLMPEHREQLTALTGQPVYHKAILALANKPRVVWIAPIGFEDKLNRLFTSVHGTRIQLLPFLPNVPAQAGDETMQFLVAVPAGATEPLSPIPGTLLRKSATDSTSLPAVGPVDPR